MTETTRTVGGVISASGQIAVGTSTTQSATQLAARFNPGPRPHVNGCQWLLLGGVCLFFTTLLHVTIGSWDIPSIFFGLLVIGAFIGPLIQSRWIKETARPAWEERVKMYEVGWICLQCGKAWIPPS